MTHETIKLHMDHVFLKYDIIIIIFQNQEELTNFKKMKNDEIHCTSLKNLSRKDWDNKKNKKIILLEHREIAFHHLGILKDGLKDGLNILTVMNNGQCENTLLSMRNPLDIIDKDIDYIKSFISSFITGEYPNTIHFTKSYVKKFLFRGFSSLTIDTIVNDIDYFKKYNVLTSRLAIFIYKICTFKLFDSDKEIGAFYTKQFGKSKVSNNKSCNISNVKAYHLSENKEEAIKYNIKIQIATALLMRDACSIENLSYATGIDTTILANINTTKINW